ncbi:MULTISPECIES: DNA repair protein RadC [unclassified Pseudomonas]|uniref:RadC family protein n=1 Tax=unclassified Pseudomonas TaxID=196821 RepID=UPI002097A366|nr:MULTISPECIES: DNA repair protein RadC [unclassified Pseudomonas]MCO7522236.1 DNA repair protein RadC [Pseudomonas sp. 1]MCO7542489.1 DNA repair protein RadC [Pseudomonas sp. VA159-2]
MGIRDWPLEERPREKMLKHGASHLSDAELLAVFLRTGVSGTDAIELSRKLLNRFGGFRKLLDAKYSDFKPGMGLGLARYSQLQAVVELAKRHLAETLKQGSAVDSPKSVKDYLKYQLRGRFNEVFGCLFLDNKHRLIGFELLFEGTIDRTHVHPRQVVRRCLELNAAAVIVCHNHPSGGAEPSQEDVYMTSTLKKALGLIDVRLIDHLVVGDADPFSFVEHGLM